MFISKENERLYLRPYNFNMCRILSALAVIVENNSGKVKPMTKALVSDRSLTGSEPVSVTHTTYISFALGGFMYYFQIDENPFFPFFYSKTPIKDGSFSRDACLEEDKKEWLYDCFFRSGCSDTEIIEAANMIFNGLVNADKSVIRRDTVRERVPNRYNDGWHWETVYKPERRERVDF